MKELVDQIKAEYEVFAANADAQVEKGNKAAGARARKAALNIMKMMKDFRKVSVESSKYLSFNHKETASEQFRGGFFIVPTAPRRPDRSGETCLSFRAAQRYLLPVISSLPGDLPIFFKNFSFLMQHSRITLHLWSKV